MGEGRIIGSGDCTPFIFLKDMDVTELRQELRKLLIAAKVYQIFADILALFGTCLFAYIYLAHYKDNPFAAIKDPFFVVTILVPFIPAAVMAYLASDKRRKIRTLLEQNVK